MLTKTELEKILLPQINEIVYCWNKDGILFQNQFIGIDSTSIQENKTEIYEIIQENGGINIDDEDETGSSLPLVDHIDLNFYLFNPDVIPSFPEAKKLAERYFSK